MNGGIHREDRMAEARENAVLDGMDVIEDDGDLRRRDAFHAIGAGAPFLLPAGATLLIDDDNTPRYTRLWNGTTNIRLDVGALEPFDGISVSRIISWDTTPTEHKKLRVSWWNGAAWVPFEDIVDTTVREIADAQADIWHQTMSRDGEIHWHRSQASSWAVGHPSGVEGAARYWVRLEILTFANGVAPTTGTAVFASTLDAPGLRAFLRGPAHSVIPMQIGTTPKILIGSDRTPRGLEG